MKKSKDEKVQIFLHNLHTVDGEMYDILIEIRDIVFNIYPKVEEKMMYGGILFFMGSEMFSGVFAYKNHVSLEFGNGYMMKDEHKYLEGKGKFRRHLKIVQKEDIVSKELTYYVKQAN